MKNKTNENRSKSVILILSLIAVVLLVSANQANELSSSSTAMNMAERIRFQDQLDEQSVLSNVKVSTGNNAVMADRIRFQDKLDGLADAVPALTMADRIHFQDRVSTQRP